MSGYIKVGSDFIPQEGDKKLAQVDERCQLFGDETGLHTTFYPKIADSSKGLLTICKPTDLRQSLGVDSDIQELTTGLIPITVEELGLVTELINELEMTFDLAIVPKPSDINTEGKLPLLLSYDVILQHHVLGGRSEGSIDMVH